MKIDMHCHTKEGSIDGKVPIDEYITLLKQNGFGSIEKRPGPYHKKARQTTVRVP